MKLILTRDDVMLGEATLWLPGTDHAGIETQFVFEKKLAKQDKSRFDFDHDTLYKMIWDYVQENSGTAVDQMKKLGASADWSRYKFTLDPDIVASANETFIKLHQDGLIYRGEKLVNYCTKCGTGYSELEIEHEERVDNLYYINYQKSDGSGFITVATTRPEPIWADTHLAVNPKDKKTKDLIGQKVINPITGSAMEIIGDEFVDPEFGTGIVKLTPAHDANDFAAAQKHHLPIVHAISTQGKLLGGPFAGKKVAEARKHTVELLQSNGAIAKIDDKYAHSIAVCYRCHSVIEPLPLLQFFIKVAPLVEKALAALDSGETLILGAGRDKILRHNK
jgi:valyl-tRNA synthetase